VPSPETLPQAHDVGPDSVTVFMTDLQNFYLAGPAVTVSWLLWIFQHATLACCIKNNLPRLYRMHRTTGAQSQLQTPGSALGPECSHVLLDEATAGKKKNSKALLNIQMRCTFLMLP
jgi:hypothetical protein